MSNSDAHVNNGMAFTLCVMPYIVIVTAETERRICILKTFPSKKKKKEEKEMSRTRDKN